MVGERPCRTLLKLRSAAFTRLKEDITAHYRKMGALPDWGPKTYQLRCIRNPAIVLGGATAPRLGRHHRTDASKRSHRRYRRAHLSHWKSSALRCGMTLICTSYEPSDILLLGVIEFRASHELDLVRWYRAGHGTLHPFDRGIRTCGNRRWSALPERHLGPPLPGIVELLPRKEGQRDRRDAGWHPESVRFILRNFHRDGLDVVRPRKRLGRTPLVKLLSEETLEQLEDLARQSPRNYGVDRAVWRSADLAEVAFEEGISPLPSPSSPSSPAIPGAGILLEAREGVADQPGS